MVLPHHFDEILSGIHQILILLATGFWGLEAVCRISPTPSQQVGEDFARIFGKSRNSPYLCIVVKRNHIAKI
jgi:hypothetical protein